MSRNEFADLLEMVLTEMSCFGKGGDGQNIVLEFLFVQQKAENWLDPKTGQEVPISPRRVLVFRPSQLLGSDYAGHSRRA